MKYMLSVWFSASYSFEVFDTPGESEPLAAQPPMAGQCPCYQKCASYGSGSCVSQFLFFHLKPCAEFRGTSPPRQAPAREIA
jgi:hypothetical protein